MRLTTYDQLREAMIKFTKEHNVEWEPTEQNVLWFVAMCIADNMRDYSRKEMAHTLINSGWPRVTKESTSEWLSECYYMDENEDENEYWDATFRSFFFVD